MEFVRRAVREEAVYRVPTSEDVAKLDQNESPFDLPDSLKEAALRTFREVHWNRYPNDQPNRLITSLSEHLGVKEEAIMVGHGSNQIVHALGLSFLERGVPVVLPSPMFALFASVARMHEATIVDVPAGEGFKHDPEDITRAAIESQAPLVIVTTPNNPTGQTLPVDGLRRMAREVPGLLVIDEAYHEFLQGPTALDLLAEFRNVLVLRTFSKAMGLAGLRLGYLVGDPGLIGEIQKAQLPFQVDRLSEAIALVALVEDSFIQTRVAEMISERERVEEAAASLSSVEVIPGTANFFLLRTPVPVQPLVATLADLGIRIRDVSGYKQLAAGEGREGWSRVSIGTPEENNAFLASLERIVIEHMSGDTA